MLQQTTQDAASSSSPPEATVINTDALTVVALGVGTKFLAPTIATADSADGKCIRDSHGEVLARRSLLRWLYAQLDLCLQGGEAANRSALQRGPNGKCQLRSSCSLHLYTST